MRLPASNRLTAAAVLAACACAAVVSSGSAAQAQILRTGRATTSTTAAAMTVAAAAGATATDQKPCGTSAMDYPGAVYGVVDGSESLAFGRSGALTLDSIAGPDLARSQGRYNVTARGVTIMVDGERATSAFRGCDTGTTPDVLFFPLDYSGLMLVKEPAPQPVFAPMFAPMFKPAFAAAAPMRQTRPMTSAGLDLTGFDPADN